jgi:hypothetical protein
MNSLSKQRNEIINQLQNLQHIRRGQISEQYIEKPGADGKMKRFGPYYVWQASIQGQKRSRRIPREEVEQVRQDLQGYQEFKALCDQLAEVTEQMTCQDASESKKNSTPRK